MQKQIDITGPAGTYTVSQKGVQFPDGTIQWGDPDNENVVNVTTLRDREHSGTFYLDREGGTSSIASMRRSYADKVHAAGKSIRAKVDLEPGEYPHIVTRLMILAIGETVPQD